MLEAGLVDSQLFITEVAVQLQLAVLQARAQNLQGGIHRLAQRRCATIVAASGKGTQAGGDTAHAVDQVVHGAQVGADGFQRAAFEEAHAVA
ncbi:hypothetical protein D9M73_226830 [compost metagenome]